MAGPTASILFPQKLDCNQVRSLIQKRFQPTPMHPSVRLTNALFDGGIEERPLLITHGEEYAGRWSDEDLLAFSHTIGWQVQDELVVAAMVNDPADHRILAMLCSELAQAFVGVVDFGGHPCLPGSAEEFATLVVGLPGRLYRTSGAMLGNSFDSFYGDAEFLRAWLSHEKFRMVK